MKKICLFGASGKVIQKALISLYENRSYLEDDIQIILFESQNPDSNKRLNGFLLDIQSSSFLQNFTSSNKILKNINLKISNNYEDLKDSTLSIISVGKWISQDLREVFLLFEKSNRVVQSYSNLTIVENILKNINNYAPNSLVFSITNHVDMICKKLRQNYKKPNNIYGISNAVDSVRFCYCLYDELSKLTYFSDLQAHDIKGFIMGFHDNTMMLLKDSVFIKDKKLKYFLDKNIIGNEILNKAISKTKEFGLNIVNLQLDKRHPNYDSGSSILPGKVIANLILSCVSSFEFQTSLNFINPLFDEKEISYPVLIKNSQISPIDEFEISDEEKNKLLSNLSILQNNFKLLDIFENIIKKLKTNQRVVFGIEGNFFSGKTYLANEFFLRVKKIFENTDLICLSKNNKTYQSKKISFENLEKDLEILKDKNNKLVIVEGSYLSLKKELFDYILYLDIKRQSDFLEDDIAKIQKFELDYIKNYNVFENVSVVLDKNNILEF